MLKREGFSNSFVAALKKSYEPQEFQNCLELNILLYLKKSDYHGTQVDDKAVATVDSFITENKVMLSNVEEKYGVPASVIASLMWLESRFGNVTGDYHVASMYVHLIQSERPSVLRHLKTKGPKRFNAKASRKDLRKIPGRAKSKAKWALGELKAMQKIFNQRGNSILEYRGSFSGAFGIPQFLPSSYNRWAVAADSTSTPRLTNADDAAHSVANYLTKNGWKKKNSKTHRKALRRYNNSSDYVNTILRLSKKVISATLASANPRRD